MNVEDKALAVVSILRIDPFVDQETVKIERWDEGLQVEFYIKGVNPDEDADTGLSPYTEALINKIDGVIVHMNDCEGCYGEGMIWFE